MAGYKAFLIQYFQEGVQLQVAPDVTARTPGFSVFLGPLERVHHHLLYAHPGLGKTGSLIVAPVGLLHIFAEGEFDEPVGSFEFQTFGILSPPQLDQLALASDWIG